MASNFTKALRELTGFEGEGKRTEPTQPVQETVVKETAPVQKPIVKPVNVDLATTHITKSMVITGDIKSSDNIRLEGQLFGNIGTSANLIASSLIVGDIRALNANFVNARIKGTTAIDGQLFVDRSTIIVGNVSANTIDVEGKIKGKLDIQNTAHLKSTALISGDILSSDVEADKGARINGAITTRYVAPDYDEDAEFDLGGDF